MFSTWLAFLLTLGPGAFPYEQYAPSTLRSVVARLRMEHPDLAAADVHPIEKYRVRAEFLGSRRPIDGDRRALLDRWLIVKMGPEIAELFQDEYLVREDGAKYWLPLQVSLAAAFENEVAKGQVVDLYVAWFCALKDDPIFVVNGLVAVPKP